MTDKTCVKRITQEHIRALQRPRAKTVRVTKAMREEIIRRSFDLFKEWHGATIEEVIRDKGAATAFSPFRDAGEPGNFAAASLQIANEYGLSHRQRYHVLEACSAFAWAKQEKVLRGKEYRLVWNAGRRRYDPIEVTQ